MGRHKARGRPKGSAQWEQLELPKSAGLLKKLKMSTKAFLETHGEKLNSYEQLKEYGDVIAFPGEEGIGILLYATRGYSDIGRGQNIALYDQDLKRESSSEGNISLVYFNAPKKFYYCIPVSANMFRECDECWFTIRQASKFVKALSQDFVAKGLYRIDDKVLVNHVKEIFNNPERELSKCLQSKYTKAIYSLGKYDSSVSISNRAINVKKKRGRPFGSKNKSGTVEDCLDN